MTDPDVPDPMDRPGNGGWVVVDFASWATSAPRYAVRYVALPGLRYGRGTVVTEPFRHHRGAEDEADRLNLADGVLAS